MSLDVTLYVEVKHSYDGGKTSEKKAEELFTANITHNLGKMAEEAGIYQACWRPEEINATKAKDILPLLQKGYADLVSRPDHFRKFDSPNGWGTYDGFLPWVKEYMEACAKFPEATIYVWR